MSDVVHIDASDARCPCGRSVTYAACCGRLHSGAGPAITAEELMRSRYSAFALGDEAYLRQSWHPSTCPRRIRLVDGQRWTGLEVVASSGGALDRDGTVEFVAHFDRGGVADSIHEISAFNRVDGRWVYVGPAT